MLAKILVPVKGAPSIFAALECLIRLNRLYIRTHPNTPGLYESGVFYKREVGREDWLTIPILYERGYGDCEDLASARVAFLRESGENASPALSRTHQAIGDRGRDVWHVVVKRANGEIEDPSRRLGM